MKYIVFIFLWWMLLPTFGQETSTPEFYLHDPSIYKKNELSIPTSYLKNFSFNQDLAEVIIKDTSQYTEINRKGFVNAKGKFLIEPVFIETETSPYGIIALLNEAGNWKFYKIGSGYIAHNGDFQDYRIVSSQYILVNKKNKWGILILNKKQHSLIDPKYKQIEKVSENTFKINYFNSWILKNKDMDSLKTYFYDSLTFSRDSLFAYAINKASGMMNYEEKEVVVNFDIKRSAGPEVIPIEVSTGGRQGLVLLKINDLYGVVDSTENIVIPTEYDSIQGPYENIFLVYREGKMGIISNKGVVMSDLSNKFEYVFPYHEGRAKFLKAGKYGFIDQWGSVRVANQYSSVRNFKEGAAAVVLNGKWGFINKDERIIVQPHYAEVSDFKNGVASAKIGVKWYFVTKEGKRLSNAYDEIKEIDAGKDKWLLVNNNKQGLADRNGKELLAPRYEYLEDLENGRVIVKKGAKWGVVDYRENFVSPIEFDFVTFNKVNNLFLFMKAGKEEVLEIKPQP